MILKCLYKNDSKTLFHIFTANIFSCMGAYLSYGSLKKHLVLYLIKISTFGIYYDMRGNPPKLECIYKRLYIYSYMFKLQSPSKYSPFDAIHLSRHFFPTAQKQFLNSLILMSFSASAVFCFTFSTLAKHFPLRTFFIWENK